MMVTVKVERGYRVDGRKIKYDGDVFSYRADKKPSIDHGFIVEHSNGYIEYLPDRNIIEIEPLPQNFHRNMKVVITYNLNGEIRTLGVTKEQADEIKIKEIKNGH